MSVKRNVEYHGRVRRTHGKGELDSTMRPGQTLKYDYTEYEMELDGDSDYGPESIICMVCNRVTDLDIIDVNNTTMSSACEHCGTHVSMMPIRWRVYQEVNHLEKEE